MTPSKRYLLWIYNKIYEKSINNRNSTFRDKKKTLLLCIVRLKWNGSYDYTDLLNIKIHLSQKKNYRVWRESRVSRTLDPRVNALLATCQLTHNTYLRIFKIIFFISILCKISILTFRIYFLRACFICFKRARRHATFWSMAAGGYHFYIPILCFFFLRFWNKHYIIEPPVPKHR